MSSKQTNRRKLKKQSKIKNLSYPILTFLDRTNALPYFQAIINRSLKFMAIKKQFNSELNYRVYSKMFKDAFKRESSSVKSNILIPCFHPVNSTIFLRQMTLTRFLMNEGHDVLFIVCDGFFNICQMERFEKTRSDFKYLCHECSYNYKSVERETGLSLKYLSSFKEYFDSNDYLKVTEEVKQLSSVADCEAFVTFDGLPLGLINKVGIMRFFQQGQLEERDEILDVYKKYLLDTYRTHCIFTKIMSINQTKKVILWSGTTGHEKTIAVAAQTKNVDYITQEMYIGNNSWIYKKNAIAIHLDYYSDWIDKRNSISFSENDKEKVLNLFSGMKTGATFAVSYNDSTKKLALDPNKKYAVLFTNMNFDMYVLGRNPIFESMKAWIKETIAFWRENVRDVTLIIRAHPGEIKLVTASVDFVSDAVQIKDSDDILFFDSDSDVNSYDLLHVAQYVLTYSSTIGAEALLQSIPCISAGETMYQNFCNAPKSKSDYFEQVLKYNACQFMKTDRENLLNYLHYLMFIKNVEIQGFRVNRKVGRVDFDSTIHEYNQLLAVNDVVLRGFYNEVINN